MAATKKANAKKAGRKGGKANANKRRKDGKKKVWDKPNPKGSSKGLTPGEKGAATKKAKAQGRSKPSLVDNINAQKGKGGKAKKKKKAGKKKAGKKKKGGKKKAG